MLIIMFSMTGGLVQLLPGAMLFPEQRFLLSPFYIGGVVLLFLTLERLGINEKSVHPALALSVIAIAVGFDFVTGNQF
ncbi:hypothetical protein H0266_02285 [Halobacillus locisalis]|uniref:Uncharacterized protein n=1 Tax=Halobacillus locisalis TaxID=220753 RepID=A0A838CPE3_9BACI|nr:hypothetical protein [Halobacillus locisalis]MBA2173718.1 hypothetical protein [Halobacillus locisalis]